MKHLLTGVAMAAALAIAAPALAQNAPMTPSAPPKAAAPAPAPKAAASKPASTTAMARKPMRHRHMASRRMGSGDQMTEQLNQQELQRLTGGNAGAPSPMSAPMPGGNNPTSGSAGPFAPAGSAPPPPMK